MIVNEQIPASKLAERLMVQPEGATMDEIIAATGGPQYNVLRKLEARGYKIRKVKEGRTTRYFAESPAERSFEATVTGKGQVTIPKEVRDALRLRGGGKISFVVEPGDRVTVKPATRSIQRLYGVLGKPKRTVTVEEMDEGIAQGVVDRYLRAVGRKR
jgi:antitoxin PrlF